MSVSAGTIRMTSKAKTRATPSTLHIKTPLLKSAHLTRLNNNRPILLKLECLQPSGSFKNRGIGLVISNAAASGVSRIVSSSGGNAGLAAAHCASQLGLQCTVVVPDTTAEEVRELLRELNAEVIVEGHVWDQAHKRATAIVEEAGKDDAILIHPFDGEQLWEGHSTIVDELVSDSLLSGTVPGAIICTVGGGGLLAGLLVGLKRAGGKWATVPVIAVETLGAHSFYHAAAAGAEEPLPLPGGITSLAKTLGATSVCSGVLKLAQEHQGTVTSTVVSDASAVSALEKFAKNERLLVEPSCSAGLSLLYDQKLDALLPKLQANVPIIAIVCGGSGVDIAAIERWKSTVASTPVAELPPPVTLGGAAPSLPTTPQPTKRQPKLGVFKDDFDEHTFVSAGGVVLGLPGDELSEDAERFLSDVKRLGGQVGMKDVSSK